MGVGLYGVYGAAREIGIQMEYRLIMFDCVTNKPTVSKHFYSLSKPDNYEN